MANCREKVSKKIENLISRIETLLKDEIDENHNPILFKYLSDIDNELHHLLRTFATRRFFIVTIGALKAGKSTLINALVGNMVSPAGTGAETTLKCSVIMSSDEEHPEGITLYKYLDLPDPESDKNAAEQQSNPERDKKSDEQRDESCRVITRNLMDYFKGITEWGDEYKKFDKKTFSLYEKNVDPQNEQSNLEYILTSQDLSGLGHYENYLLAEIRIDVSKASVKGVLQDNLAIIDMPGVDGTLAGTGRPSFRSRGNPIDFLPEFCHLFLLVQSTISGLNQTTATMIKKWQAGKRKTPAYLVFNSINALDWYEKKSVINEMKKAKDRALAELAKQKVFYNQGSIVVNAAKAWEASNPEDFRERWKQDITKEMLYKESNIDELKTLLNTNFSKRKDEIILNDAVNNVQQKLEEFIKQADNLKQEATKQKECIIDENKFWDDVINCFEKCFEQEDCELHCTYFDNKWSELCDALKDRIEKAIKRGSSANWLDDSKTKYQQISTKANNVHKALVGQHLDKIFSDQAQKWLKEWFDAFMVKLHGKLSNLCDEEKWKDKAGKFKYRQQLDQVRLELKAIEWLDAIEELKKSFEFTSINNKDTMEKEKEKLTSLWSCFWSGSHFINYANEFVDKYEDRFLTDLKTTIQDDFRNACIESDKGIPCLFNTRLQNVKKKLEEIKMISIDDNRKKISQYECIIKTLPKVRKGVEDLKSACEDFNRVIGK